MVIYTKKNSIQRFTLYYFHLSLFPLFSIDCREKRKKKKKKMVRGKIELKKIENANRLQVSFTNRRKVLMKKANDLSILCDADVALIVFSNTGDVYNFSSRR